MPHWSGLLTITEATQKAAVYTSPALSVVIERYISVVKDVQTNTPQQRSVDLIPEVVDINVVRFFTLQLLYTVDHSAVGQPAGFTRITKISWL